MASCVPCNTPPPPCNCKSTETCVQTPRNCTTCPQNICINNSNPSNSSNQASAGLGGTIGGAVGGTAGGLMILGIVYLLWKRTTLTNNNKNNHINNHTTQTISKQNNSLYPFQRLFGIHHHHRPHSQSRRRNLSAGGGGADGDGPVLNPRNNLHSHSVVYLPPAASQSPISAVSHQHSSTSLSSHQLTESKAKDEIPGRHLSFRPEGTDILSDDPFSDQHGSTALHPPQLTPPLSKNLSSFNPQSDGLSHSIQHTNYIDSPSATTNHIPIAYIPPNSKSLSIADVEERDGIGNPSTGPASPDHRHSSSGQPNGMIHPIPSPTSALQSSFPASNNAGLLGLPISSGGHSSPLKPIRPPRAPDLDLRLPSSDRRNLENSPSSHHTRNMPVPSPLDLATSRRHPTSQFSAASSDRSSSAFCINHANQSLRWSQPLSVPISPLIARHNIGSTDGMPSGARLSLDSSRHTGSFYDNRPISAVSDATTHDSHLSSILDPAMIVTPVTLVRTASGRQAAVQRVALRGQEKARVVRLSQQQQQQQSSGSLPTFTSQSHSLPSSPLNEEIHPTTPTASSPLTLADSPIDYLSSPSSVVLTPGLGRSCAGNDRRSDEVRISKLSAMASVGADHQSAVHYPSMGEPSLGSATSLGSFSFEKRPLSGFNLDNPFTDLAAVDGLRKREEGAAASEAGSRESISTIMDGDESRLTPSRKPRKMSERSLVGRDSARCSERVGDRTISLSSIITEEARSYANMPPMPYNVGSPHEDLPGPFKPFAGQRPGGQSVRDSGRSMVSNLSLPRTISSQGRGTVTGMSVEHEQRMSGESMMSIRSGYGSVLEGIPFNIAFHSEGDDLFGVGSRTSESGFGVDGESQMDDEESCE